VIILEGVLLWRNPVDRFLDVRVFLDVPEEEVLRRAILRDGPEAAGPYMRKYIPIQKWFDGEFRTRERADLIVDNTSPDRPVAVTSTRDS
jgi:uridine kinase